LKKNPDFQTDLKTTMDAEHYALPDVKKTMQEFMQYGISSTTKDLSWQYYPKKGTWVKKLVMENINERKAQTK
jgi:hypothetical protein